MVRLLFYCLKFVKKTYKFIKFPLEMGEKVVYNSLKW